MSKSSRTSTPSSTPKQAPTFNAGSGTHKPFSWTHGTAKDFPIAEFVGAVFDISAGIEATLQLVNSSTLDRIHSQGNDSTSAPMALLSVSEESVMLRFALAASGLLHDSAERKIDWINDHGTAYLDRLKGQP